MNRPCLTCGELSEQSRCDLCAPTFTAASRRTYEQRRLSPRKRGYDAAWTRLSARARALQPWCSRCGTSEDLTTDHTPQAWARKAEGLPIRLEDVDVLCRSHNASLGSSRPGTERASA